jgi:hypothetical protein
MVMEGAQGEQRGHSKGQPNCNVLAKKDRLGIVGAYCIFLLAPHLTKPELAASNM